MDKLFESLDSQREIAGGRQMIIIMSILFVISVFIAGSRHASPFVSALGFVPFAACGVALGVKAFRKGCNLYAWVIIAVTAVAALPVALVWAVK